MGDEGEEMHGHDKPDVITVVGDGPMKNERCSSGDKLGLRIGSFCGGETDRGETEIHQT